MTDLLGEHRDQLDSLTQALLKAETLDAPDAYAAAGVPMRAAELPARALGQARGRGTAGARLSAALH